MGWRQRVGRHGLGRRRHQTLGRELPDVSGPFADLPAAQAAVYAWVHTYNTVRPSAGHQPDPPRRRGERAAARHPDR
ncbi:integrase core domain-containing protein [Streptomyces sp. NBC_01518]|uniref:integrase core domain-containing protein n=1 Tax=Streptomyces sp. NBC_01518 TaxID=2903891 RepID=UPI00386969CC